MLLNFNLKYSEDSRTEMDDAGLLEAAQEWIERLGLTDWNIHAEWCASMSEGADGLTEYVSSTKSAIIYLLTKEAYDMGDFAEPYDIERVLVHELLHLKFSLLCKPEEYDNTVKSRVIHQMIDDMARALVDTRRCGVEYGRKTAALTGQTKDAEEAGDAGDCPDGQPTGEEAKSGVRVSGETTVNVPADKDSEGAEDSFVNGLRWRGYNVEKRTNEHGTTYLVSPGTPD